MHTSMSTPAAAQLHRTLVQSVSLMSLKPGQVQVVIVCVFPEFKLMGVNTRAHFTFVPEHVMYRH